MYLKERVTNNVTELTLLVWFVVNMIGLLC